MRQTELKPAKKSDWTVNIVIRSSLCFADYDRIAARWSSTSSMMPPGTVSRRFPFQRRKGGRLAVRYGATDVDVRSGYGGVPVTLAWSRRLSGRKPVCERFGDELRLAIFAAGSGDGGLERKSGEER